MSDGKLSNQFVLGLVDKVEFMINEKIRLRSSFLLFIKSCQNCCKISIGEISLSEDCSEADLKKQFMVHRSKYLLRVYAV